MNNYFIFYNSLIFDDKNSERWSKWHNRRCHIFQCAFPKKYF